MDSTDPLNEKKWANKAKSYSSGPKKFKSEPVKRKSFNENEAVRSLDLAVAGRLKKSKLVNGEFSGNSAHSNIGRRNTTNMFIDSVTSSSRHFNEIDNTSLISMNLSHYELMRNLSRSNCNSDGAFSSTHDAFSSLTDIASRDENLERYFRSVDLWGRYSRPRENK